MSNMEDLAASLGINLVSETPSAPAPEQSTEPIVGEVENPEVEETAPVEETDVLENNETSTSESEEVATETASVEQGDDVIASEPVAESTETEDESNTGSVEFTEDSVLKAVAEMAGLDELSKDDLLNLFTYEEPVVNDLDPSVKAIQDFISETGKTVEDWFNYQSFNPSEMDDMTVMLTDLKQNYPDLSNEDAQLLLGAKYKQNEDEYSENDIRLGKLQLKMDATNSRKELEKVRQQYAAPARKADDATAFAEADVEPIIDDQWIANMSKTVDSMETLKFNVGDKDFTFGLKSDYRSNLKKANADLENYFVQYVDDKGDWDYNKLSTHRAVVDNIDAIVKSVYQQGLSDGQGTVVKDVVNPSSTAPSSASVNSPSAEDKVRQQILNALQGSDDTLRIRF